MMYYNFGFFLLNQDSEYMCYPHDTNELPFKCTMKKDICANKERFARWDSMSKDAILSNWM